MICDLCDYMVAHTYCCGFREFPEDWVCRPCERILEEGGSSSSQNESDNSDEESVSEEEYKASNSFNNF
jgi:hypothetical protein